MKTADFKKITAVLWIASGLLTMFSAYAMYSLSQDIRRLRDSYNLTEYKIMRLEELLKEKK